MRTLVILVLGLPFLRAQDDGEEHTKVYDKTVNSVVAVRAMAVLSERSGTGVILDPGGYILTSYSIVPEDAEDVRVWIKGPRMLRAKIVKTSKRDEITILKIETKDALKPIEFVPDSSKVKVGEVSYSLGNAYNSFINDDQPSFNFGIVSGFYNLKEAKVNSYYVGYVFETTAAINWGMEGGPMLDPQGRMVGMITLNYSASRWLGNAIPMNALRERVQELLKQAKEETATNNDVDGEGYIGIKAKQDGTHVVVTHVDEKSPAGLLGISKGDVIDLVGTKKIEKLDDWNRIVKDLKPGSILWVTIVTSGVSSKVSIEVGRKPK